jgi:catechol 2,3-dioxygenase-like lactoylglutathione lyase family enzyme
VKPFGCSSTRRGTPSVSALTDRVNPETTGMLHHVELWVPDLERGKAQWGWLLGGTYLVIEQSPAMSATDHDRLRPGLNHLAFHAGTRQRVDALTASAPAHGWSLLFPDRHPFAGGGDHYAAYLATADGYEVELVATSGDA